MSERIYVASSWRNARQPDVVRALLRVAGHEVYDFRSPRPGDTGFHWSEIDPQWQAWDASTCRSALDHAIAQAGFASDFAAMQWATAFVLVQPCGRSAHLELGWAAGAGKRTAVLLAEGQEPELMVRMVDCICITVAEVLAWLEHGR